MKNRWILVGGAALALVAAVVVSRPALAHGAFGWGLGGNEHAAHLADALGISVDDLRSAQDQAMRTDLQSAVDAGRITQEQADLRTAAMAVSAAEDPSSVVAESLGMTADELQSALDSGQGLGQLMHDKGVDMTALRSAMQQAHSDAIDEALADGSINADQAYALKAVGAGFGMAGHFGMGMRGGRFGGWGHGHFEGSGRRGGFEGGTVPHPALPSTTTPGSGL